MVQFTVSWDNSWRTATPNNWDAAWVFVKYKVRSLDGGDGLWRHASLNNTSVNVDAGSISYGLLTPGTAFHATTNPVLGAFLYRSAIGTGPISFAFAQLRWNYGEDYKNATNKIEDNDYVEIKVFAIEMVYVPGGAPFNVGDGSSAGTLRQTGSNTTYQITTTGSAIKCENTSYDDAQLQGSGIYVDGDGGISKTSAMNTEMNPDWPTGFNAFYCMKYEIMQQQYVDFLNMLTRTQQATRVGTTITAGTTSVTNRYVMSNTSVLTSRNGIRCDAGIHTSDPITLYCDLSGNGTGGESNDGQYIACNYLSWADLAAYLYWSGLRPMTELEFEKSCRGTQTPENEYAWGNATVYATAYTLGTAGTDYEVVSNPGTNPNGNANYSSTSGTISGPLRVGSFATSSSDRIVSGATYYGIMEMSGNLWERSVTIGHAAGRLFTGTHGNGVLASNGDADASTWPGINAVGAGFRGAAWNNTGAYLRVSDRYVAAGIIDVRDGTFGGRGVRSAP
jgi:formylglycine-generating enzyme required for sulfatase activity